MKGACDVMIYMDNAATTKMHPDVVRAMLPYMGNRYGNPSGIYTFSKNIKKDITQARELLASTIGAGPDEIFFTSGGSESDNWALKMAAQEHPYGSIITTPIEHHAILRTCDSLEKRHCRIIKIPVDKKGKVRTAAIERNIFRDTFLISVMAANNEIGTVEPVAAIGRIAHERNILFHTDAVQAYTNIYIDVNAMNVDMLSVSAHKIRGPKGVGFLYIKKGKLKTPFINGGGQEYGMRAGTENVAGIIGLAKAAQIAMTKRDMRIKKEKMLRDYMIKKVTTQIKDVWLNGDEQERLPNNMNFSFKGVDGATLILMLDQQGICASAGSACSSAQKEPSHVLKAIGLSDERAYSTVRFTINEEISKKQVDYVVECIKRNVEELRKYV